ncbi:hypothetical protein GGX14DRAFT_392804 [Mycena pura]|uniref:Uncharacterized protein n=1 Tax=Mycena pura TaxID=153505 RepID=A0AAD6VIS6_9AGAR|nr:hypothetical protein GGX14DRAFT_392804 [Mycena pura]
MQRESRHPLNRRLKTPGSVQWIFNFTTSVGDNSFSIGSLVIQSNSHCILVTTHWNLTWPIPRRRSVARVPATLVSAKASVGPPEATGSLIIPPTPFSPRDTWPDAKTDEAAYTARASGIWEGKNAGDHAVMGFSPNKQSPAINSHERLNELHFAVVGLRVTLVLVGWGARMVSHTFACTTQRLPACPPPATHVRTPVPRGTCSSSHVGEWHARSPSTSPVYASTAGRLSRTPGTNDHMLGSDAHPFLAHLAPRTPGPANELNQRGRGVAASAVHTQRRATPSASCGLCTPAHTNTLVRGSGAGTGRHLYAQTVRKAFVSAGRTVRGPAQSAQPAAPERTSSCAWRRMVRDGQGWVSEAMTERDRSRTTAQRGEGRLRAAARTPPLRACTRETPGSRAALAGPPTAGPPAAGPQALQRRRAPRDRPRGALVEPGAVQARASVSRTRPQTRSPPPRSASISASASASHNRSGSRSCSRSPGPRMPVDGLPPLLELGILAVGLMPGMGKGFAEREDVDGRARRLYNENTSRDSKSAVPPAGGVDGGIDGDSVKQVVPSLSGILVLLCVEVRYSDQRG